MKDHIWVTRQPIIAMLVDAVVVHDHMNRRFRTDMQFW